MIYIGGIFNTPFVCPDCVEIPEGVTIGTQTWKQCNATHTTYRDDTPIPEFTGTDLEWTELTTGAWCYINNDTSTGPVYGKLYNWYAIAGIYDSASLSDPLLRKQFAPTGYHVPLDTEWTVLTDYLGGSSVAGGKIKSTGTIEDSNGCWTTPNEGATNESEFGAVPSGRRNGIDGTYQPIGSTGYFYSLTEVNSTTARGCAVFYDSDNYGLSNTSKKNGYSVRLIKDYEIGDLALGGKIAYILQYGDPGYIPGEQHGLIATVGDISLGTEWGCYGITVSGADGTAIGTGNQNTEDIIANACTTAGKAANLCKDLVEGGYNDWYLPSKDELSKLYINKDLIGGFDTNLTYWSSTEFDAIRAYRIWFFNGTEILNFTKNENASVRAVRSF